MSNVSLDSSFYSTEIQFGYCPIVNLRRVTCMTCEKRMYPALMANFFGKVKVKFICYRCGSVED